ncbi:hypothetical protein [Streptomyces chryseus]|uniref:hypothetical protein n=1 Tax=Streptomyces chryseus TaxID=68186 RepID=UPI00110FE16E|nr:hypothetical protein [Streptomyces chryseus]
MGGIKGRRQEGRTGNFNPEATTTVTLRLAPATPERIAFEALLHESPGVSGAEVLRELLIQWHSNKQTRRSALREAG